MRRTVRLALLWSVFVTPCFGATLENVTVTMDGLSQGYDWDPNSAWVVDDPPATTGAGPGLYQFHSYAKPPRHPDHPDILTEPIPWSESGIDATMDVGPRNLDFDLTVLYSDGLGFDYSHADSEFMYSVEFDLSESTNALITHSLQYSIFYFSAYTSLDGPSGNVWRTQDMPEVDNYFPLTTQQVSLAPGHYQLYLGNTQTHKAAGTSGDTIITFDLQLLPVPEPGSLSLLIVALTCLGMLRRSPAAK